MNRPSITNAVAENAKPGTEMAESAPSRPPLALIANDQEWSIRSLESILQPNGYAIIRAYSGEQAIERARETAPDLIIIDANFPDLSGIDVCRTLRQDPRISSCAPILVTTAGRRTRHERLEALAAGAWDFIGLPLDAEELLLRLASYMRLKFESDRTREESLIDPFTGLYNLKGLMRRARELGSDAYRHGRPLACVAFAPCAERNGAGVRPRDERTMWTAVERLAQMFKATGRVSDAIGRVRLGEFVVIAPGTGEAGALKLAKRLVAAAEAGLADHEGPSLALLAGYDAVTDLRSAGKQAAALLAGATTALRQSQAEPGGPSIRRYDGDG